MVDIKSLGKLGFGSVVRANMLGFVSMSLFREGYGKDTRRGLRRGWKRTHQIKLRLAAGDAASSSGGASASLLVPSNK